MWRICLYLRYARNPELRRLGLVQVTMWRLDERAARAEARAAIAEAWVAGFAKGLAKSIAEGGIQGAAKSRAQNILTMLDQRDIVSDPVEIKQILRCTDWATRENRLRKALNDAVRLSGIRAADDLASRPAAR